MFEKGDVVLYGTNGICDITDIEPLKLKDEKSRRLNTKRFCKNMIAKNCSG